MATAKTSEKQPPKKKHGFRPGESGNPKGRPQGSRNKATILAQEMLDGEVKTLVRKCIDLALAGDQTAMRLCLERLLPPRKDSPVKLKLPKMDGPKAAVSALSALLDAVGQGELSPGEAQAVAGLLESFTRTLELEDLAARVATLENK